ncbi:MAG TPA: tRNA epoxyqueuosine(34) reductase QueG [Rhodanobacteraceae bacterium]|nr:tRNA epoxyqueuosine(34) reductase QueG [Rhodanobacteraceae bacterium]
MNAQVDRSGVDFEALAADIRRWAHEFGFADVGISAAETGEDEQHLQRWLDKGHHGTMEYMQRHGTRRSRPAELHPGTCRIISVRMDYAPAGLADADAVLADGERGYVSRYALGRDYHKLMRQRLQKLADRIGGRVGDFGYRAFVDSAPVLEKALARNAGLGWIGKHTLLINSKSGSYFFLGELFTDLPLPVDPPASAHCGSCTRCIDVCPTQAIVGPYQLDARRCISYLTIELKGSIPEELRAPMGNRIFGCDECQLACPWNKFAQQAEEPDFAPRHSLDGTRLVELFGWSEDEFLRKTEGMAIRRTGYEGWLRNIAVALGNAPPSPAVRDALKARADHPSAIVREHVAWALRAQLRGKREWRMEDRK